MKLSDCIQTIKTVKVVGSLDKDIAQLSQDSREMLPPDSLYVAVVGTQVDGHDFIHEASAQATAIICEVLPEEMRDDITYIQVANSSVALGEIAACFYQTREHAQKVIAITGTNGKTSVAHYLSHALEALGEQPLLLSTAGDYFKGEKIALSRKAPTSLEVIELHRTLNHYYKEGALYVCLEATSQGLHQYRLAGIDIAVAIFTNLDQDHLDYHGTLEDYAKAKKMLFDQLSPSAIAISNFDDPRGAYMVADSQAQHIRSYGTNTQHDYHFAIKDIQLGVIKVDFNTERLTLPVIGVFNVYNLLAVYATLCEMGYQKFKIKMALTNIQGVPGRVEQIQGQKNTLVIVDYAHSPGALENVLSTIKELPHNNIRTVIGCGGDRDRSKRAPMAQVAQAMSNWVFYTNDNPRTEDPQQIFNDMKKGVNENRENFEFIENREEAIAKAILESEAHDVVLIAGKGHENYQVIGTVEHPFDDKQVAQEYLKVHSYKI